MVNAPSRQELDSILRKVFIDVKTSLDNVQELADQLSGVPDAIFTDPGNGYEYLPADLTNLKAAIGDLLKLKQVAEGAATQATVKDFYLNTKKVWGVNLIRR